MTDIPQLLGSEAGSLLTHACSTIPKESVHLPGPDCIDRVLTASDRRPPVPGSLAQVMNPMDLTRCQAANFYIGRAGSINSGGESKGAGDLAQAVPTAVIDKRAAGMGLTPTARRSRNPWPKASRCAARSRTSICRPE